MISLSQKHLLLFKLVQVVILILLLAGCQNSDPIKIGFSGCLTGRLADLGVYGRNGVMLAVEEVNQLGGISGRKVELLIRDDKQDPDTARKVDRELIDEGVVAIIGHMTSSMSMAVTSIINQEKVLYFSPTTATNQLVGTDDFFLRTISTNRDAILRLANHVINDLKLRRTVVVYDDNNRAFSKEWVDIFSEFAQQRAYSSIGVPFRSQPELSFSQLTKTVLSYNPDGVLIVAAALDAAMICQQIRKAGADVPIFTTMWSMSKDFIQHGGSATEGVSFISWFDHDHPATASSAFHRKYQKRFGHVPTYASHFAYETANILFYGLEQTTDPKKLKKIILEKGSFSGTQGTIKLDKYGDTTRDLFLMKVINGGYKRTKKF